MANFPYSPKKNHLGTTTIPKCSLKAEVFLKITKKKQKTHYLNSFFKKQADHFIKGSTLNLNNKSAFSKK